LTRRPVVTAATPPLAYEVAMDRAQPLDPDLTRPSQNGVYFVNDADLDRLAMRASGEELAVRRIDLADCHDATELLRRLAAMLDLSGDDAYDWDSLADRLRHLAWLPAWGHALLFGHAGALHRGAEEAFDILLGLLDDAATFAQDADRPFFAFLALPEHSPNLA
jgi:hypothetical protein